jgi:hypothetical protein
MDCFFYSNKKQSTFKRAGIKKILSQATCNFFKKCSSHTTGKQGIAVCSHQATLIIHKKIPFNSVVFTTCL